MAANPDQGTPGGTYDHLVVRAAAFVGYTQMTEGPLVLATVLALTLGALASLAHLGRRRPPAPMRAAGFAHRPDRARQPHGRQPRLDRRPSSTGPDLSIGIGEPGRARPDRNLRPRAGRPGTLQARHTAELHVDMTAGRSEAEPLMGGHSDIAAALPQYEIVGDLGRGTWGVVLRAVHRQLGRPVAIKQLPSAFAADPAVRHRFLTEARLLATLDHPHIVPIFDYQEHEGVCLLVMELLPGGTLRERLKSSEMTIEAACSVALATASALGFAHNRGIFHRDVKPENLLFTAKNVVKVSDFGIAKIAGANPTMATGSGELLGTPAYMSPEQATGRELTAATDIYALGTVLFEMLSGRLPFDDDGNALGLLFRHVHGHPVHLGDLAPDVPAELSAIVMRCLARDPADRYQSADALGIAIADVTTALWGPRWLARRGMPVVASEEVAARLSDPMPTPATRRASASTPVGVSTLAGGLDTVPARPNRRSGRRAGQVQRWTTGTGRAAERSRAPLPSTPQAALSVAPIVEAATPSSPASAPGGRSDAEAAPISTKDGKRLGRVEAQTPSIGGVGSRLVPRLWPGGRAQRDAVSKGTPSGLLTRGSRFVRRATIGGAAVAVVAIAAVSALVLSSGGRSGDKSTATTGGNPGPTDTVPHPGGAQGPSVGRPIAVGLHPNAIAITPNGSKAYVVNFGDNTVTPIRLATGIAGTPIHVGKGPVAIAFTPDGATAYVANFDDVTITPITLATGIPREPIRVGTQPSSIAISPTGVTAYVTDAADDNVVPITLATGSVGPPIHVGRDPTAIAITPDGAVGYVANMKDNTVTPISLATGNPGAPIRVGKEPHTIEIAPDGLAVYVLNFGDATMTRIDVRHGTAGPPILVGNHPADVAISPNGAVAYVANSADNTVVPVVLASGATGAPIPLGRGPNSIAIAGDGATAYVADFYDNTVTPIRL